MWQIRLPDSVDFRGIGGPADGLQLDYISGWIMMRALSTYCFVFHACGPSKLGSEWRGYQASWPLPRSFPLTAMSIFQTVTCPNSIGRPGTEYNQRVPLTAPTSPPVIVFTARLTEDDYRNRENKNPGDQESGQKTAISDSTIYGPSLTGP